MARPKKNAATPAESAAQRTRKDAIISTTMPHATRCLADMLAAARGLSRSEYFRFLVLEDCTRNSPTIIAEAMAQGIHVSMGRPVNAINNASPFALQQEAARKALSDKFPFFETVEGWRMMFAEANDEGENCYIEPQTGRTFTIDEFCNLPLDLMNELAGKWIAEFQADSDTDTDTDN